VNGIWSTVLIASGVVPLAIATCGPAPRHRQVEIRDLTYQPPVLTAAMGDTVTWTNHDIVPHTVTLEQGGGTDEVAAGATLTLVIASRGTLQYRCRYHPTMTAQLDVR